MQSGRGCKSRTPARVLCLLAATVLCLQAAGPPRVDPSLLAEDIRYLSSPELGGRGSGTPALDRAAAYIARRFAQAGVKPLPGHSYLHPFTITTGAVLENGTSAAYTLGGTEHSIPASAFLPFSFSGLGRVSGQLVFAGYGISAPECGYDDYLGIDVKGKIVVLLKHEPQEFDGDSPFEGRVYSEHSQYLSKALNARAHGASAVLLVNDTANHPAADTFEPFLSLPAPGDAGIPYVQIQAGIVEAWFRAAGRDFTGLQREIDRTLAPASFAFPDDLTVSLSVAINRRSVTVHNVAGYIPGLSREYVIVGAHYDHLGTGEQYSLEPGKAGTVHPGADDNASGAAGVLALARVLARRPTLPRGVLLVAFAGEELGLLGSVHYVNHPPLPLGNAVAMINMDMIGRMRDRVVTVGGAASGEGFQPLLVRAGQILGLRLDTSDRAIYGSSDHTSFRARGIPILFFFTGLHADYHRPTDTPDKIEMRSTSDLVSLIALVTEELCRLPERPRFVAVPAKPKTLATGAAGER